MTTSPISINNLAADSLAHIFSLLPPNERVRLERVCRHWRAIAQKYSWTEFKTLTLKKDELTQQGANKAKALAKFRALLVRSGPHLRLLSIPKCAGTDELLQLAASCCPRLAILLLPIDWFATEASLTALIRFENLFYLRLSFAMPRVDVFGISLEKIGAQLRALSLRSADHEVLQLIAKHCPLLEHCSFFIIHCSFFIIHSTSNEEEELLSGLRSVFQLAHLRSVSIYHSCHLKTQFLAAINELNAKGNLEYLHLSRELSMRVGFIANLFRLNPKLRRLNCAIEFKDRIDTTLMGNLKTLLLNMGRPLELDLVHDCPPELETGENSMARVWGAYDPPESISKPMVRQFWGCAMDSSSVPDLDIFLDD